MSMTKKLKIVLQKKIVSLKAVYYRHATIYGIAISVLLITMGAFVFYFRYPFAYDFSNFYAEDGKDFMKNIIEKGPLGALITPFNGYLIVGQYLVGIAAQVVNQIFGNGFETLAKAVAVASYVFWGTVCALPFMLFRKRLGILLSIILSVLLWSTPFGSYDYAVIGTIGNLKFAFLFIATLLVILRNDRLLISKRYQFYLIDIALLICVLTNIVSVAVLPFVLMRYINELKIFFTKRKGFIALLKTPSFISLAVLAILSAIYILAVKLRGIPDLPGYLDGPLDKSTLALIGYRSTLYGITFPVNYLISNVYALIALIGFFVAVTLLVIRRVKQNLVVATIVIFALMVNVAGFVINRPGVTSFFTSFSDQAWPGLFFYAGTMLTLFLAVYLIKDDFNKLRLGVKFLLLFILGAAVMIALPAAGFTHEDHYGKGTTRPTLSSEVRRICGAPAESIVEIYPASDWQMKLDKSYICN